jgi:glutamate-1-semialdehyde aminotransferase
MRYFEVDGVSTGLFEALVGGMLPAGLLPGKGKRFKQESLKRLREWVSGGGARGEEIRRALGVAKMKTLMEDTAVMERLEPVPGWRLWRGLVAMADETLTKTATYEDIIGSPEAYICDLH